jgi:uncharacterized protein
MRVVFDTNVVISALLYDGKPLLALNACILTHEVSVTSPDLLAELAGILVRKFHVPIPVQYELVRSYQERCEVVTPAHTLRVVADEPDNRVLECAVEGGGEYIVTGVKALLALGRYKNVTIVSVENFLQKLSER